MNRNIWGFSVVLASLFLLGHWIPEFSTTSNLVSPAQSVLASTVSNAINPAERKEMESLALGFTKVYYTYTLDNYLQEGQSLLPLLTKNYQETYRTSLEKSYTAAKAVQAESSVVSAFIMGIEKTAPDTGVIKMQFKAKVLTHEIETLNRYSTTLELKNEDGAWRINDILEEDPVAFSNLRSLL
ncbi:hypothetical protein Desdi_1038 [Desulfitobacterium dichloroeliminans LMG P-21439]|uniref:DUF3828 domain-containing protein n=1 Tax=Desulfitobacterium dichloroeliminans (strain LMG P-21439 / DCA1) TaxID=871963 RepID=L0F6B6_DESDL|nr:hypothetical protein [Desulfitobacterium dichloroeliminans]AGA68555.1 hypothetical protein Desdi_1038 [Desulfitobacterium dichloroeliminans LMG P-21439]